MKRKLLISLMMISAIFVVAGCEKKVESQNNNQDTTTTQASKGNCKVTECISLIKPDNTVEEINNIIGFEGELKDEKYYKYTWTLNDTDSVSIQYGSETSKKGTITIDYDKNSIINDNIDFSKYSEIKALLDDRTSLTYQEFVEKMGNVEGVLVEKTSYSKYYMWQKSDGRYLKANFSESTGKCTSVFGRI